MTITVDTLVALQRLPLRPNIRLLKPSELFRLLAPLSGVALLDDDSGSVLTSLVTVFGVNSPAPLGWRGTGLEESGDEILNKPLNLEELRRRA